MQELTQGKKQRFTMTMQLEFINRCRPQVVLSHHRENCTNFWSVMDASYNCNRWERQFLEDGLVVPGGYSAFSTSKKPIDILHKELQRQVLPHMKFTAMEPKIKSKLLYVFLSLYRGGAYFIFFTQKGDYWGGGGLNRENTVQLKQKTNIFFFVK